MKKYFCEKINGKIYVKGKCCENENYDNWIIIDSDVDCGNKYINLEFLPIWKVKNKIIINEPLELSNDEKKQKELKKKKEKIKVSLIHELIEDAIKNPDDNNPIKVWINEQLEE